MTVSFLLRLLPDRLLAGEIVGEVHRVGDGEHALVRDAEELRAFLVLAAPETVGEFDGIDPD